MGGHAQTIGRYRVRGELGGGGFATVYRAYDPMLDREVALKVLHSHLARDTTVRERFVREGRALARVRHLNIVQIFDAGEVDGSAYLAMELVEGPSLGAILKARGPVAVADLVPVVDQVGGALAALHDRGLIHRDIKPANILIERSTQRAVVLDLGVVRGMGAHRLTTAGWLVGTPTYMAPEQLEPGGQMTPQTDVYQLGATVYALLAGRPPFTGETMDVLNAIVGEAPPDLGDLRPDLPPGVIAVVSEALAKNPARRPPGTRAFAEQFRAAVGHGAPTARPAPVPQPPAGTQRAPLAALRDGRPAGPVPAPAASRAQDRAVPTVRVRREPALPPPAPVPDEDVAEPPPAPVMRPRRRLLVVGVAALAVALLLGGATLAWAVTRDGGRASPVASGTKAEAPAPTAEGTTTRRASTPQPPAKPSITDLKVYNSIAGRQEGEFEVDESVVACFTLTPGRDGGPIVVVASDREQPPRDANDASVVARSEPVPQREGHECHPVPILSLPLPPGRYSVFVLHGAERLGRADFQAKAKPGDTILRDDFKDPAKGKLPAESSGPSRYRRGYEGGEYVIQKIDPAWKQMPVAELPGAHQNATLAIDARLVGETRGRYVVLVCRNSAAGHYRLMLAPTETSFSLTRWDRDKEVILAGWQQSTAIRPGIAVNRLELTCAGDTISATINGTQVLSVQDTQHRTGGMWIGVDPGAADPAVAEARFANLTVTQR